MTGGVAAIAASPRQALRAAVTSPEAFVLGISVYVALLLWTDTQVDLTGQLLLGAATWTLLAIALIPQSHGVRATTIGVVVVSIGGEILASLILGLYTYRLENVPLFVPPGHGLLYLAALTASKAWIPRRWPMAWVLLAAVAGSIWAVAGLTVLPQKDLLGALAWLVFLYFLWIGNVPPVYASAFWGVTYLELMGTQLGNWRWNPDTVGLDWLPCGNPPVGAPAGYALFELGAFIVGPWIYYMARGRARRRGRS